MKVLVSILLVLSVGSVLANGRCTRMGPGSTDPMTSPDCRPPTPASAPASSPTKKVVK